jgi:hypothetical protein
VSVDWLDFPLQQPSHFSPASWYSPKLKGPGVRYEIAICLATGEPVWTNGPFPCGTWSHQRITRSAMVDALEPGECFYYYKQPQDAAEYGRDGRYYLHDGRRRKPLPPSTTQRCWFRDVQRICAIRARHKMYLQRLHHWAALRQTFRHDLLSHSKIFHAITNIVQVTIVNGEPLLEEGKK